MKKSHTASLALTVSVLVVAAAACTEAKNTTEPTVAPPTPVQTYSYPHVTADSTMDQIVKNPAFAGFGAYMVPAEDPNLLSQMAGVSITTIAPAIGWHDPQDIVDGLNFMIDEVNSGAQLWHPLYSADDIAADASKGAAGLWFISGDADKPLAVVAAGGGFRAVESLQEAFPLAKALHGMGYNVAILKYRVDGSAKTGTGGQKSQTELNADADMVAAMQLIQKNADGWHISLKNYSVWGSSAGGMVVSAWAAVSGPDSATANGFSAPAMVAALYTPPQNIEVSASLPPYFISDTADDKTVSPAAVADFAAQLKAAGVDVEFERYPTGGHGFGIGTGTSAAGWLDKAVAFWQAHMTS
jgi:acetyl esterase/lipase